MTTIPALIDILVNRASPVQRLRPPLLRASLWLAFAAVVLALLAFEHGLRSDLAEQLRQPTFALGLGAAATTGILSAIAAFAISIPDRSPWCLLLPAPALVVWVGTIS